MTAPGPPTSAADPLAGLRVVECASFVAGPSGGMALARLGADVLRVDPPGGGGDFHRWPVDDRGTSLYWASLNKGKRSLALDFRAPEGRELLLALATDPGPDAGIYLDNVAGRARLTSDELSARRADTIHVHVEGAAGGKPGVDYTVNAAVGVPDLTGPADHHGPVNHALPAWDFLCGQYAVTAILAALHRRTRTGAGASSTIALSDVALAAVGDLGWLAEAHRTGRSRERIGNHTYGSFGVDFPTADGRRVIVVALTGGQWTALCRATGTTEVFAALEPALGADLSDESDRYRFRETIEAILRPWFAARPYDEVADLLDESRVLWGPYRDMAEATRLALADATSVVREIDQPGIGPMAAAAGPIRTAGEARPPQSAPALGADTDAVLSERLGLSPAEIGRLHDAGLVAGPA
ncbi:MULTISPECIES: CoA transferase [Prauserella salsuginis group]|uniref:CoA transferase n=1 Tax=Prauserella salsuginis TaxID=387889 RepID=A0ABW6G1S7_9PSEU|nr:MULTISPECIES: CoA transferase [Prauserella salsuginis group]MCR3721642.1 2-methylfumaryl-CoA isomerase [Prauserella flava]MCR3734334.1 2-methylfumaryl-CoA isomerase [Prauserella salsuginis]